MNGTPWLQSVDRKYGASLAAPQKATTDATATATLAPAPKPSLAGMLSPADPMFWFGVIAAGTVALMAYSTAAVGD
jgi:hypothetical protein